MVNYCCVNGCGRNSRLNKHLNYYSLPKERHRRIEWLKAACREDLLKKNEEKGIVSYRFCSRHFPPSCIKNRHLSPNAVPTLCLPGSLNEDDIEPQQMVHSDIICDNCSNPIAGFRYKCVSCNDYDLCQKCEMQEAHPNHYMLRIPKPLKFKLADNLIKKWRKLFKVEHVLPTSDPEISLSSDDEPITIFSRNYDSGVDLSEDVKLKIRKEVNRALNQKPNEVATTNIKKMGSSVGRKRIWDEPERPNKRRALKKINVGNVKESAVITIEENTPDLVFADVNQIKNNQVADTNNELPAIMGSVAPDAETPYVHVKISDDISQLLIKMKNTEKVVYKFEEE